MMISLELQTLICWQSKIYLDTVSSGDSSWGSLSIVIGSLALIMYLNYGILKFDIHIKHLCENSYFYG